MPTLLQRLSTATAARHATLPRWSLTVLTALLAVLLRALLQPVLGDRQPFVLAYPAIVFAASMWGIVPGLVVALTCALASVIPWIPPAIDPAEQPMHIGAFTLVAIFICLVCNLRARSAHDGPLEDAGAFDTPLASWLRAALWGSVLIPLTAFLAASWWGYERAVGDAEAAAERTAVLVRGQAAHTFEIAQHIAQRADLAAAGDDAAVRLREAEIHARLADMVAGLPSVVNLNVWDAEGRPIARSDRFPTDHIVSVKDRPYFQQQLAAPVPLGISDVLVGRQTGLELMNVTIRRSAADGRFTGLVAVSLAPSFFRDYYRSLAAENPTLARFALVRIDGAVLAVWPQAELGDNRVALNDAVFARVKDGERSGHLVTESRRDGQMRFVSFQRVGDLPLYVVAGVSRSAMLADWLRFVGLLAALLVPVTAGLAYVSLVALRKTRREQAITAALNEAVRRRATAEKGMLESQKLETLAQLTGGVAHDFNNLLAIVSSSLHVHCHLHPELEQERHVQAMARAVRSGTRLTRQLLSFSRKQALRPEQIVLQTWLPGAQGLLHSTLGSRIEMHIAVDEDVSPVEVDNAELELALINLCLNAKHAMPGGGALRIAARNEGASEDGTTMVVLAVSDNGVGIAPEVLPHVFEPFYTTRMDEAGSGLGLSQVHGFCAQAGGSVRIASVQGQGTTVELVLPALVRGDQVAGPGAPGAMELLAGRVLLVEDNEDVASSTAAILQSAGLQVTHYWSADTALAALQGGAEMPDIVLSDIEMPGQLSGMDLAFRLRELWPGLPVMLITGYAKQLEDALSGGLRVLPKPTPPRELLRELRAAMAGAVQPPR
jgi:two-component system NtrC family sensor kinase